jgi:hypothetical protein
MRQKLTAAFQYFSFPVSSARRRAAMTFGVETLHCAPFRRSMLAASGSRNLA